MKNNIIFFFALVCFVFIIHSCEKNESTSIPDPDPVQEDTLSTQIRKIATVVDDQNLVFTEIIAIAMDAYKALDTVTKNTSGTEVNNVAVCGGTISWNTKKTPLIGTITYDGNNCDGSKLRTGTITISFPGSSSWHETYGATTLTFNDLKIKRLRDSKTIVLGGTQFFESARYGTLEQLPSSKVPMHLLGGPDLTVLFDNGEKRAWSISANLQYRYDQGIVMSVLDAGLIKPTIANISNVSVRGINRFGGTFATEMGGTKYSQKCNYRLTSGLERFVIDSAYAGFANFGLDSTGVLATCPQQFFYKLNAYDTAEKNHRSIITPY